MMTVTSSSSVSSDILSLHINVHKPHTLPLREEEVESFFSIVWDDFLEYKYDERLRKQVEENQDIAVLSDKL